MESNEKAVGRSSPNRRLRSSTSPWSRRRATSVPSRWSDQVISRYSSTPDATTGSAPGTASIGGPPASTSAPTNSGATTQIRNRQIAETETMVPIPPTVISVRAACSATCTPRRVLRSRRGREAVSGAMV